MSKAATFTVTISEGRRRIISATIIADDWLDAAKQLHSILYQQSCVETQARPLSRFTKIEIRARAALDAEAAAEKGT